MERAQEITLDYLRIRKQFGKLIGKLPGALQHQAVNIYVRIEAIPVARVSDRRPTTRSLASIPPMAAAAKAKASEDALFVTEACIQLHGAIGFTDEHDVGLYSQAGDAAVRRCSGTRRRSAGAMWQSPT